MGATLVGNGDVEVHILHTGNGFDANYLLGGGKVDECEGNGVYLEQGEFGLCKECTAGSDFEGGRLWVRRKMVRTSLCRARMELTKELQMSSGRMKRKRSRSTVVSVLTSSSTDLEL